MMIAIILAAFVFFVLFSLVLSRDDGTFGVAIRLSEILLPFAAAVGLSGFFLKGLGASYFPAACAFGFALAIGLLRRLPSFWHARPPEGAYVFVYAAAIVAGLLLTAQAAFHFSLLRS